MLPEDQIKRAENYKVNGKVSRDLSWDGHLSSTMCLIVREGDKTDKHDFFFFHGRTKFNIGVKQIFKEKQRDFPYLKSWNKSTEFTTALFWNNNR